MVRIMVNAMYADTGYSVHFIGPDGKTRVGPWLIRQSAAQLETVLAFGTMTAEECYDFHRSLRQWGRTSNFLQLTEPRYQALLRAGRRRPENGYELEQRWQREHATSLPST